jgi:hypothetical protein
MPSEDEGFDALKKAFDYLCEKIKSKQKDD